MIGVLSFSYKTTPVEFREKLALAPEHIADIYQHIDHFEMSELVIISTCNRVEFVFLSRDLSRTIDALFDALRDKLGLKRELLQQCLQAFTGRDAVAHLFRVSSALESMVLGEPQILGQVKDSYEAARKHLKLKRLEKVFMRAFMAAKRVRNETKIAENAVSVSFAAVELARKIFGDLQGKRCMLIGAGEMCELAAKHLHTNGVQDFVVANRTLARAEKLALMFGGKGITLDDLGDHLSGCDIVISSTGANEPVITHAMVKRAMRKRGYDAPMFFIDIAVPRDVEESVNQIDMVYCYDIDDLQQVVEENKQSRIKELDVALALIEEEVDGYFRWIETHDIAPIIVGFRREFEGVLHNELQRFAGKGSDEQLAAFGRALMNKFLHIPSANLKKLALQEDGATYVDAFKKLYDLEQS
ncbi:glutamyl-tRNA reductase [Chrysiogenes arsenatis]|uniref:glutamyl-tRNA reductase n=1 Tax=Chrysiogenes arsenatis TaxID=309797 RepID=UPI0004285D9A|nr:glutamyl-tRNA reductase [Chrysiogenes arsenatis]